MKYVTVIHTILHLMLTTVWCQQEQYHEMNLINYLNAHYDFDHNIFFVDSTTDPDRCIRGHIPTEDNNEVNFTPQTIFNFNQNLDYNNETQPPPMKSLTSKNTFLIVFAKTLKFEDKAQLWGQVKTIHRLDGNIKIAIFFVRNVTSMDMIEELFQWSWSTGIVNIFCAFYYNVEDVAGSSLNIFRFDPFPKLKLINVTESVSLENYFPDKVPNYQQHIFRFVRVLDWHLQNHEIQFWQTVVRVFNASAVVFPHKLSKALTFKKTEYVTIQETNHEENRHIYPHRRISIVLIVPHALPYSSFFAYLQNKTWTLLFAYTLGVIVTASLLLIISGYLQTKRILIFQRIVDVINLLMNDNGRVRYGGLHRADIWIVVPLTFTGLIVVNGILSVFQSYITLPIYERQINTLEDLYKSPYYILVNEHYWANRMTEVLENITGHGGWGDKVRATKLEEVHANFISFNTSVAYLLYSNQAEAILEVQRRLGLEANHLVTNTYIGDVYASYTLNDYFPFFGPINDIFHRLEATGLTGKWFKDGEESRVKDRFKRNLRRGLKPKRGSGNDDRFTLFTIVWSGWITSTILFVGEVICNNNSVKVKPKVMPHLGKS